MHPIFSQVVERIIKEQENIIGPLAVEQAQKVPGLKLNWKLHEILIEGNETLVVETLIERYRDVFGQASIEVCREAVHSLISQIPKEKQPPLLQ